MAKKKRKSSKKVGAPEVDWSEAVVFERAESLKTLWAASQKKVLIIRPRKPGDTYTEVGSNVWAGKVKTKAQQEGWTVIDLDANNATRQKIVNAIQTHKPRLIFHYDHGGSMTLWGQKNDNLEPGLDDQNIQEASGQLVSTVSCLSASGLGPVAIGKGVTSYLGYTDLHGFWTSYEDEFGDAANAANFALLECKTMQQAFDAGWAATDQLYQSLLAQGGTAASLVAPTALANRDRLALLGSQTAKPCPQGVVVCAINGPDATVHCRTGHPDSLVWHCKKGQPDAVVFQCVQGAPDSFVLECGGGLALLACGKGPAMCTAGPPLRLKEILVDYPYDHVLIDRAKVPRTMRKAFDSMVERIEQLR